MIEIKGNLFDPSTYSESITPDAICITTNGFIKENGLAVMGRGCAKQSCEVYPGIDAKLGLRLRRKGNQCHPLYIDPRGFTVMSFPVKEEYVRCNQSKSNVVKHMQDKFSSGELVPGWASVASIDLIRHSAYELYAIAVKKNWSSVVIPRPGCGAGELDWFSVKAVLDRALDSRFYVITF